MYVKRVTVGTTAKSLATLLSEAGHEAAGESCGGVGIYPIGGDVRLVSPQVEEANGVVIADGEKPSFPEYSLENPYLKTDSGEVTVALVVLT